MRVVELKYEENVDVEGITLYRYLLTPQTLAVDPNYYQTSEGIANMTSAKGIPLFLSKPHFLDAPAYQMDSADAEKHDTVVDVEPTTGATMNAKKRLQVCIGVTNTSDYFTENVTKNLIPLMWIEEGATIPEDLADDFKSTVYGAKNLKGTVSIALPSLGVLLLAGAGAGAFFITRKPV